ncbi:MAG: cysteine hydrolase [bacterium]|nr:cysteine hydrolase [bacterium]
MLERSALLVIDVQNVYCTPDSKLYIDNHREIVTQINRLIEIYEKRHQPVIYIRHALPADGDTGRMFDFTGTPRVSAFIEGSSAVDYPPHLKLLPNRLEITKHRYSSFVGTGLQTMLTALQIDSVTITGFMTNICCESTARHAHDLDYYVYFVNDAVSCPDFPATPRELVHHATLHALSLGFAVVQTTQEILATVKEVS